MIVQVLGIVSFFLFISCSIAAILSHLFEKKVIQNRRISSLIAKQEAKEERKKDQSKKLWNLMVGWVSKKLDEKMVKKLEDKLKEAGYPLQLTPASFILLKIMLGVFFFFFPLLLLLPGEMSNGKVLLISLALGVYGASYPTLLIKSKIKQRLKLTHKSMPEFFDMVCLSIEAGLGLDLALHRVCQNIRGPLSEEFQKTLEDMKMGVSRRDAFTDLKKRVKNETFQSVISALIQADRLGVGMSTVLRAQSERIRYEQLQQVRGQALKIPVKMLIPMVLFIFPVIFLIILGPIIVKFLTGGLF